MRAEIFSFEISNMGYKTKFSIKIMPRNLDSSTTGIGDPYHVRQDHHVACATDRNVHTVF